MAPPNSDLGLESLHDCATALRNELVAGAAHVEHLTRKRADIQSAIPPAEAKYESGVEKRKHWEKNWKQAIESISAGQEISPNVVSTRLKKIADLFQVTRDREKTLRQIQSIDDESVAFADRACVVAKLIQLEFDPNLRSVELAQQLYDQLQASKVAASQLAAAKKDVATSKDTLKSQSQSLESAIGKLGELCREAGVDSPEGLIDIEQRASEKRSVLHSLESAESKLTLIADGQPIAQFAEEVERHDAVELDAEILEVENELETLDRQWSSIEQQVGGLKKELSEIDGGDRAAELNQSLQFLVGRIERESQEYAKLRIGSMILRHSIEHYRNENESPVLKLACNAFEELTCGRYAGLKPEYDEKGSSRLYGIEKTPGGEGNLVPVDSMSLGTADALYLAMRLASLDHQMSAGHTIPVVIDDCLIQLDDDRAVAAMKRFSQLSTRTQVVLFTHHRHLIDLAESSLDQSDYHIHRLPAV